MKRIVCLALVTALSASAAYGAVNMQKIADNYYYAGVLINGPAKDKFNIVFVGDGFQANEQKKFDDAVTDAVAAISTTVPYSDRLCALNIWKVHVVSTDSGVDHPKDKKYKNTELNCRYGNPAAGEAERCITTDSPDKCNEAASYAPAKNAVFVLVNDTQWGGCAGDVVCSSIAPGFASIITHELGHKIGGLADEYTCYVCDGSDNGRNYTDIEPTQANLTKEKTRDKIKWNRFIMNGTTLPTTVDNPVGVIGAWAGGGYYATGIYRPASDCRMRTSGSEFCRVCEDEMRRVLSSYCSPCQIDPNSGQCLAWKMRDYVRYRWTDAFRIRLPIPPCMSCPLNPRGFDTATIVMSGLPQSFELRVIDELGSEVSRGEYTESGFVTNFISRNGDQQYMVEVISKGQPNGELLEMRTQLYQNNMLQTLPAR